MLLSWNWLREVIDLPCGVQELAELFTRSGCEIESLERPAGKLSGCVVAKVLELKPHPDKDTWLVALIDAGTAQKGEKVEVVTAATNLRAGDVVPYAPLGATLADGTAIGARSFGSLESAGMLLSAAEIGLPDLADEFGILRLDLPGSAPGDDLLAALGLDDWILDVSVTPNRGDLLSILGLAREAHALVPGSALRFPEVPAPQGASEWTESFESVSIDTPACLEYALGFIEGATAAPSPMREQVRLIVSGMRPIDNIVDATNLAMLFWGQPLHAFDFDRLPCGAGGKKEITVRCARDGERIATLDGKERVCVESDLLITSAGEAVAIAGVMGGLDSEIHPGTKRIALESAIFDPASVGRTSRRLGLPSQAAFRYNRGTDRERALPAMRYALSLMAAWAGGKPASRVAHTIRVPREKRQVLLDQKMLARVLLWDDMDASGKILNRLGFEKSPDATAPLFTVPSWRNDVSIPEDLVEEVGRVRGWDEVPSRIPGALHSRGNCSDMSRAQQALRRAALARGLQEVVTYSFLAPKELEQLEFPADDPRSNSIEMLNPISADQSVMRTTLLPGLLRVLQANLRAGWRDPVRVFEMGRVFLRGDSAPVELERIGGLLYAGREKHRLYASRTEEDFYSLKADLTALAASRGARLDFKAGAEPFGHLGQTACVLCEGQAIGYLATLKPRIARNLEFAAPVYVFEIEAAPFERERFSSFAAGARFPSSYRDIALLAGRDRTQEEITADLRALGGKYLINATLFDVFSGEGIPDGTRSLAYSLEYRHDERTLADEEVEEANRVLRDALSKKGYTLR